MKRILLSIVLSSCLCIPSYADDGSKLPPVTVPEDFKSDGCSMFPDGSYWECCVEHDKAYYVGGSWRERLSADNKLFNCVADKDGVHHKLVAPLMWLGVRVGGVGFLPTRIRWGFGRKKSANPV